MCDPSFCYENNSIRSFTMGKWIIQHSHNAMENVFYTNYPLTLLKRSKCFSTRRHMCSVGVWRCIRKHFWLFLWKGSVLLESCLYEYWRAPLSLKSAELSKCIRSCSRQEALYILLYLWFIFLFSDKSTQHQVILQARSAAPLMKMEGVFWQGIASV